jgi:hypothetical protein
MFIRRLYIVVTDYITEPYNVCGVWDIGRIGLHEWVLLRE